MDDHPRGRPLRFRLEPNGPEVVSKPEIAILAGYTGRVRAAVLDHIRELEELGVAPPPNVPMFYAVPPELVTQREEIVTTELATSGEAEVGLVVDGASVYVTVASDHTDRAAERLDTEVAKRLCFKVIAASAWRLEEVQEHWDSLQLCSWIGENGESLYQQASLSSLLSPSDLLAAIPWRQRPKAFVALCGTVPTIGGMQHSQRFRAELLDPVADRRIEVDYVIEVLDFVQPGTSDEARIAASAQEVGVQLSPDQTSRLASQLRDVERPLPP